MAQPNWFRICVGCGQSRHKNELLRIVRIDDQQFEIDVAQKQPGRGAYICPAAECAVLARKKRALDRSFHQQVAPQFYELVIQKVKQIER